MRLLRSSLALVAALSLPAVALACIWDHDTIKMERSRFPDTLELITGKFLRHSPEFYQWRIDDRLKKLEADPTNAALLDDLAVAYDKTGQHEKAIETAQKTEKLHPGRYETAANLGTFYFHAGKLGEGLPHIDRALTINPNAHFGREKYQKLLVEYVIERRKSGRTTLPLAGPAYTTSQSGFAGYLTTKLRTVDPNASFEPERPAAIKGILGMMKFGNHQSPILLEALGTLLADYATNPTTDAKLLAARAYLKASFEVSDGPSRQDYRRMAQNVLSMQTARRDSDTGITLEQVEEAFQKELAEARGWYAELRERELSWIRNGKDPEAEFDKLYYAEPEVSGMDVKDPMRAETREAITLGVIGGIALVILGAAGFAGYRVFRWARREAA